jgi:tetrahydromethanopterin S-methyltransferase subunit G
MEEKKGLLAELGKVLEQYDSTEDIVKQNVSNCMQSFSKELGERLREIEKKRLDDIESKLDKLDSSAMPARLMLRGKEYLEPQRRFRYLKRKFQYL